MALTAGQSRWFNVNVRSKRGMKSGNTKSLHDLSRTLREDTSIEVADHYARAVRKYHSRFIADYSTPIQDETLRGVLMRHSHFRGGSLEPSTRARGGMEPKGFVYNRLFNPLGTMSTAMHVVYDRLKDGDVKVYVHGADILEQEYGTGTIAQREPHPISNPSKYNLGPTIKTDEKTGIMYWVYGQYARVGSPSGHFAYDAWRNTRRYVKTYEFKNAVKLKVGNKVNEEISALIVSGLAK